MRRTAYAVTAAVAAAASLVLAAAPSSAKDSPATANAHSIKTSSYVALGDSYSSAAGVQPFVPGSPVGCSRSSENYAHDIAAVLHPASFTDVTCSGAKTQDFYTPQQLGSGLPSEVPPQLNALSKSTRLVTMTIGGNDENVFVDTFFGCADPALVASDPTGAPCEDKYGKTFDDLVLTQTYPNLVRALKAVRAKAPAATVAILGYPEILPPRWVPRCAGTMPFAQGDVPYLYAQQALLNSVVREAAAKAGARFIDMSKVSAGHDACEGAGTRWIEPAVGPVNAYPVHPNAVGEKAMAAQTLAQLGLPVAARH